MLIMYSQSNHCEYTFLKHILLPIISARPKRDYLKGSIFYHVLLVYTVRFQT